MIVNGELGSMNMWFWSNLLEFSSQQAEVPFVKYKLLLIKNPIWQVYDFVFGGALIRVIMNYWFRTGDLEQGIYKESLKIED